MTDITPEKRVAKLAISQVGYHEKESNSKLDSEYNNGNKNFTKYAYLMDSLGFYNGKKNGYAWCGVFYDWLYVQTFGVELAKEMLYRPDYSLSSSVTYAYRYFNANYAVFNYPMVGDQVFYIDTNTNRFVHTGIVVAVYENSIQVVEGNTNSDGSYEGTTVLSKFRQISDRRIKGFGRPRWSKVSEECEVTQDKFNEMFKVALETHRAEIRDNSASEYSKEAREWAVKNGIISGSNITLEDGSTNYMWRDEVTREQLVTLLYRIHKNDER